MKNLKAILVDDEKAARETLENYVLKYCEGVELIGQAKDVPGAIQTIKTLKPDLVFLDVEMPFGNAFDVLEQCADLEFETIFITAFNDYAIKAFNFSAAYYILKPIDIGELIKAVNKVRSNFDQKESSLRSKVIYDNIQFPENKKLVLPTLSGFEVVYLKDILRLHGSSNYTEIYLVDGKKKVVSKVLKFFEDMLQGQGFMRVHRSHIVRLDSIKKYNKGRGGSVVLSDNSEIEVSAQKKQELMKYFD
ncbi:MAG: response regulator transcription factor [Flavobacteriales bacterium]|nr:response regulator transcription factor [Flavobacteriales bacterium]